VTGKGVQLTLQYRGKKEGVLPEERGTEGPRRKGNRKN